MFKCVAMNKKKLIGGLILITLTGATREIQAQNTAEARINTQAATAARTDYQERVYVRTDKPQYLAGEIIWFQVYGMDASTYQPSGVSKVAYIELLDRNTKPVLQAKISLSKRGGEGSFYLPTNLRTDHYLLRAYTSLMRNEKTPHFYETTIAVTNTVSITPTAERVDSLSTAIDFYPEGGQLLQGHQSTVAFKITGKDGRGAGATGILLNAKGDTLTQFQTHRFGIGRFSFTPQANETYRVRVQLENGRVLTQNVPAAETAGYLLNVTTTGAGALQVRAATAGQSETLTVVAHTRTGVRQAVQIQVSSSAEGAAQIERARLAPGINFLTLFNSQQQPVAERLIFVRPDHKLNADISLSKNQFTKRDKVTLGIAATGQQSTDSINYSIAVYQAPASGGLDAASIQTYRWLQEELLGTIESPGYYFSADAGVEEATDNLLLTHGWRRFAWAAGGNTSWKHTPEVGGHLMGGRVINKNTGQPGANILCYLSAPAVPYSFQTARSNSEGYISFEVNNYYGPGEIVMKVVSDSMSKYRIDVASPFAENRLNQQLPLVVLDKKQEEVLIQRSIAMQAQNLFLADSLRHFLSPALRDTLPFYGKAEYIYKMDDYKRFSTVEETFREYVFPTTIAMRNGKPNIVVHDGLYGQAYDENVLVLLDGIPLADHNKIFGYDPIKLKRLDVVTRRYVLGAAAFAGIISFETYKGKFDAFDLDPSVIMVDYEGLQLRREFYAPDYAKAGATGNRLPDMRTTLQWIPSQVIPASGKSEIQFYTSDQKGRFVAVLEGLSDSGQVIMAAREFVVE
ncbi:MAG: hypothetical protein QM781_09735 [Chitinophagaceae bacterium]